jgi:hypothetical protein
VLEFDLNFNNAFLQTALGNYGQNPGAAGTLGDTAYVTGNNSQSGAGPNRNCGDTRNSEVNASIEESTNLRNVASGTTRSGNIQLQVAEMFHDRLLNQVTDLVTAEMRIFGDPFFIPQQTGNYVGQPASGSPNLTTDGTVNYMQNEVFLVVNFKTPFDYQIEGATMEFPRVVPQFSGLFSCWAVTNSFSKGRFEQTLKLIRRRGQDDTPTTGNGAFIVPDDTRSIVNNFAFYDDAILRQQRAQSVAAGATVYDDAILRQQRARTAVPVEPPRVSVGGVTFDPRTGTFPGQPASSATPIYDDAIFRAARRNQLSTMSAPQQPVYDDAIMRLSRVQPAIPSRANIPSPRPIITPQQTAINREASLRSSAYQQTNYTRAQPFSGVR